MQSSKRKRNLIKFLFYSFCTVILSVSFLILSVSLGFFGPIPTDEELSNIDSKFASKLVDRNGEDLGYIYDYFRIPVESDNISDHVKNALVSTEDERFYEHSGIDYRALLRVLVKTIILQDRSAGGGSTINMQLVKNLYPRSIDSKFDIVIAKIKEAILASRLDDIYSKDEILTLYLNTVSFSDNTYGIEAAAKTFFSTSAFKLNIVEAATLIGSLKATYTYNPRLFPDQSMQRRNVVLAQMLKNDHLDQSTYDKLAQKPINLDYKKPSYESGIGAYFREKVRQQLEEWLAEKDNAEALNLYSDGLRIETTLDKELQVAAEKAAERHLKQIQKEFEAEWGSKGPWNQKSVWLPILKNTSTYKSLSSQGLDESEIIKTLSLQEGNANTSVLDSLKNSLKQLQIGFVVLHPVSREVLAYIGGSDYQQYQFDHVRNSKRQVGSTIKPFLYTAALESGIDACEYFEAEAVKYNNLEGWQPENASSEDYKHINVTMKEALRKSMNTVSVKILEKCGIGNFISFLRDMGLETDIPKVPSLALGTMELSVMELAEMYATLLSNTEKRSALLIRKIYNSSGDLIADFTESEDLEPVYEELNRKLIIDMMKNVAENGTAKRLSSVYNIKKPVAAKTGTTQRNNDAWFVGLLPNFVSVCWVGNDHGSISFKSTRVGQGANAALPMFARWYTQNDQILMQTGDFPELNAKELKRYDCKPIKEDGFLKKLFSNKEGVEEKDYKEKKKKKGFFKRLFGN